MSINLTSRVVVLNHKLFQHWICIFLDTPMFLWMLGSNMHTTHTVFDSVECDQMILGNGHQNNTVIIRFNFFHDRINPIQNFFGNIYSPLCIASFSLITPSSSADMFHITLLSTSMKSSTPKKLCLYCFLFLFAYASSSPPILLSKSTWSM